MRVSSESRSTRVAPVISWLVLKIFATLVGLFALVRVISPSLMSRHDDLSFWAGVACWPAGLVVLIWAGVWIAQDLKIIRRRLDDRKRLPRVL
jgi:hypothetical protein